MPTRVGSLIKDISHALIHPLLASSEPLELLSSVRECILHSALNLTSYAKQQQQTEEIRLEEASVALIRTPMWKCVGPGKIAAMGKAERILRDKDVKVEQVYFPAPLNDSEGLKRLHKVIISAEAQHRRDV
jgi:hypothetical protein